MNNSNIIKFYMRQGFTAEEAEAKATANKRACNARDAAVERKTISDAYAAKRARLAAEESAKAHTPAPKGENFYHAANYGYACSDRKAGKYDGNGKTIKF